MQKMMKPDKLQVLALKVEQAEHLLIKNGLHYRGTEPEAMEEQKIAALAFLRILQRQIKEGELNVSAQEHMENFVAAIAKLEPQDREPAFRCVASCNACLSETSSFTEKALCGVALVICFSKEVIPLA